MSRNSAEPGHRAERSPEDAIRLQVFLARCGLGSRRSCETFISHGRVTVNGVPVTQLGDKGGPRRTSVTLDGRDGRPLSPNKIYIAVHKPREFLCANSDPERRPLVSELFSSAIRGRLFHVGRLDFLSTGLILYTNDGEFAKIVAHPGSGIEKEYLVETGRAIDDEFLRRYSKGIRVGEQLYRCKSVHASRTALRADHPDGRKKPRNPKRLHEPQYPAQEGASAPRGPDHAERDPDRPLSQADRTGDQVVFRPW